MKKNLFLICLLFIAFGSVQAQKKYKLTLNPTINSPIKQNLRTQIKMNAAGQDVSMDMNMGYSLENTGKTDSSYLFKSVFNHISMNMDAMVMQMKYDSDKPEESDFSKMMHQQLGKIINLPIIFEYGKEGKILSVKFPEGTQENDMLNAGTFDNMNVTLPANEVALGDSWAYKLNSKGLLIESNMKLEEVTDANYKIAVDALIFGPDGTQMGTMTGYYLLDKKTCLNSGCHIVSEIDSDGSKMNMIMDIS